MRDDKKATLVLNIYVFKTGGKYVLQCFKSKRFS